MKDLRERATRMLVWGTAVLAAATLIGGVAATAATAAPMPAVSAADDTSLPEATMTEKVEAARLFGIVADDKLLILPDWHFVHALWLEAKTQGFTATAEAADSVLALPDDKAASTLFIRTTVFQTVAQDKDRIRVETTQRQLSRESRQRATACIGIVGDESWFVLTDDNFIRRIIKEAIGPLVKSRGKDALAGDQADWTAYIDHGICDANKQDVEDAIAADQTKTEAEKEAARDQDAKRRAAGFVAWLPTPGELALPHSGLIGQIETRALALNPPAPEVAAAAHAALATGDPAAWKAFIYTGIYAANQRDIDNALAKKAADDRTAARQLQAKAENSKVHPALAEAARIALAGTDADVDEFLRKGQYAALTQSLTIGGSALQVAGGTATMASGEAGKPLAGATWKVLAGLADVNCYSLESATQPGYYLRVSDFKAVLAANDGSDTFKKDATWCVRPALAGSGVSLESASAPGRYLRQLGTSVGVADASGVQAYDRPCGYKASATWTIGAPDPRGTGTAYVDPCALDRAHVTISGNRTGVLLTDGTALVRDEGGPWATEATGVRQLVVSGNRIGVVMANGDALVKEGSLNAVWATEHSSVTQLALSGDRIGVLRTDGIAWVKAGPLNGVWVNEHTSVTQLALSGDRIGVVRANGDALVKSGPLNGVWVTEQSGGVTQVALSGDRIGVLWTDGFVRVKEGALNAPWVNEHTGGTLLVLAGNRIGVVRANRDAVVKEGPLNGGWVTVAGGASELALDGNRIGVVLRSDEVRVGAGGLNAVLTTAQAPRN